MEIVSGIIEILNCLAPPSCAYLDRHRKLEQDVDHLRRRVEGLNSRKADIKSQLEAEDPSEKQVREQVEDWLSDVQRVTDEVQGIEKEVQKVSFFCRARLGKLVREKIGQVDRISQNGSFPEGLVIDRPQPIENLEGDVDDLRRRVRGLNGRKADIRRQLEAMDLSEKLIRKQVEDWLEDVQRVTDEMQGIEEEVQKVSSSCRARLGKLDSEKIGEVDRISQNGSFPEGLVIDRPQPIGITLPTETLEGEDDVKTKIWEYLRCREVGIIGVYGIGGVGKTTIMKHIHNELLLKETGFDKVIWVTVSQSLNVVKLQGDIACQMRKSLPEDGDELNRAAKLMNIMKTVKYVLIFDDVWDKFTLQGVGIPKPTTENGCKVVITSRSRTVCWHLDCDEIVKVQPLSEQESYNLFLDKVGRGIQQIPNLEEILQLIVGKCAGLPLAIVVIAGSMKGVEDIREWRNALTQISKCVVGTVEGSEDEIFNRLKFSYNRLLKPNIQNCFLYCSLYPEDWQIWRTTLIENWICEGLIEESGSRQEMHEKGHTILNRLEDNCLVEKCRSKESVKMHDAVRDMALQIKRIGPSKFMVKANMGLTEIPEENKWTKDLEKVSLMNNDISCIPENMSPKCLMLSTLILEGNKRLRQIPDCFFANMPLLKLLNLSYTAIKVLPNSICTLENLTALILCGCDHLKCMPSLAKLKALKKLDLYGAGLLVVPEGLEMLVNLQYLDLSCPHLKELPAGMISNLSRLQYLCRDKLSTEEILREEAATLKKLENFEGGFCNLKDFNDFVSKSKHLLGGLNHYMLAVGEFSGWQFNRSQSFDSKYCLKRVILVDCKIGGEDDDILLPGDLQVLSVEACDIVGDVSIFIKNTTQLRGFSLTRCKGIKCVVSSSSLTVMKNIEEPSLTDLPGLRDLVKVEKTTASLAPTISTHIFSNLKEFHVSDCSKLIKLFPCELLQGQGLQNLELIEVVNCRAIEEIIGWEEEGGGNQTTATSIFTLPKLRKFKLEWLPELKRISPERVAIACDSLESLTIKRCKKLKRISLCLVDNDQRTRHPALQEIRIYPKEWWESLEWDNPNTKNQLQPLVQEIPPYALSGDYYGPLAYDRDWERIYRIPPYLYSGYYRPPAYDRERPSWFPDENPHSERCVIM